MTRNIGDTFQFSEAEKPVFSEVLLDDIDWDGFTIEDMINGPINVEDQPYVRDILSPTPIDPFNLVTIFDYPAGALYHMRDTFMTRVQELGIKLPDYHENAIEAEIEASHKFQMNINSQTMAQIKMNLISDPSSVTEEQARTIYRERLGRGSSIQRLRIVAEHKNVHAIEDMKITAPINERKILIGLTEYYRRLHEINNTDGIDIRFIPPNQQPIRMVDVKNTAHPGTIVTKRTVAIARVNDAFIDLRQKDSYVCIPTDVDLGSAAPVIRNINGVDMNIQHVAVSAYWAERPEES